MIAEAWTEGKKAGHDYIPARELAAIAGELRPHQLTPLHFASLVARWKQRYKRNTVWLYRQGLRRFVEHIEQLSGIHQLAKQIPRVPRQRPRTLIAAPGELPRLLAAAPGWLRCAILLAAHAGLRPSDCLRCAPHHYNAETHTLTITQKKTGEILRNPTTNALHHALIHAPTTDDPTIPFVSLYRGQPLSYNALTKAWQKLKRLTNTNPHLTFHDLRRTYATAVYDSSAGDLRLVEQALGHQSLSSTAQYLEHRDPEKLRAIVQQLKLPTEVKQ